jgi:hypothetical protein
VDLVVDEAADAAGRGLRGVVCRPGRRAACEGVERWWRETESAGSDARPGYPAAEAAEREEYQDDEEDPTAVHDGCVVMEGLEIVGAPGSRVRREVREVSLLIQLGVCGDGGVDCGDDFVGYAEEAMKIS